MTVAQMRTLLGLGSGVTDVEVVAAYAAYLSGLGGAPAGTLPVSLDEAKRQLKLEIDDSSRDVEIQGFIDDAAGWVERYTGHILAARDVTEHFGAFDRLYLRAWPVAAGAVPVVTYLDMLQQPVPVAAPRISRGIRRASVFPSIGSRWPTIGYRTEVSITIRAGYEQPDQVPRNMTRAMLILIAAYDEDREGGDLFAKAEAVARGLCGSYRARGL